MSVVELVEKEPSLKDLPLDEINKTLASLIEQRGNAYYARNINLIQHLRYWTQAKQRFFKMFGGKLKIEKPVEFTLQSSDISARIRNFIREYLQEERFCFARFLFEELSYEELTGNKIQQARMLFGEKVMPGTKISRLLAKAVHKEDLHGLQTKYSMLIQDFKVKGKAVLSIDPIDYITMSENRSGWSSCHRINGEYRTGTLAYMTDDVTLIAYVTTGENAGSDNTVKFENKNWRQCVYFGADAAVQSRHYPNFSLSNEDAISELIKQAFKAEGVDNVNANQISYEDLEDGFIQDNSTCDDKLWYNDILSGSYTKIRVMSPKTSNFNQITVGTDVDCICGCGRELYSSSELYSGRCAKGFSDEEDEDYDDEE